MRHELVRIPMVGAVENRNVSVAADVCLYKELRQRLQAAKTARPSAISTADRGSGTIVV